MRSISAEEFKEIYDKNEVLNLIDVRSIEEYKEVHVTGAVNIPLNEFSSSKLDNKKDTIYLICRSGGRSRQAQEKLSTEGVTNTVNVLGGTDKALVIGMKVNRSK
ncbi:MAG: rhodanese-like domain-containing protein [Proteobacteria bacterium]|nr:rhodanese-like domain-containing protein [Pseudomonadota bacterium]